VSDEDTAQWSAESLARDLDAEKPSRFRRLAAFAAFGAILAGAILGTGVAKASPLDDYTVVNAPIVCALLNQTPNVAGVENVISALHDKGLTSAQAGEVVGRAVVGWCPDQMPEVQGFVAKWGTAKRVMA
jgi:hypothetical protein